MPTYYKMEEIIKQAINEKRLLEFYYENHRRDVEPHIYGRKNGQYGILAYQVGGESSSGKMEWKRMYLDKIIDLKISEKTFSGKRDVTGPHSEWDEKILIVQ